MGSLKKNDQLLEEFLNESIQLLNEEDPSRLTKFITPFTDVAKSAASGVEMTRAAIVTAGHSLLKTLTPTLLSRFFRSYTEIHQKFDKDMSDIKQKYSDVFKRNDEIFNGMSDLAALSFMVAPGAQQALNMSNETTENVRSEIFDIFDKMFFGLISIGDKPRRLTTMQELRSSVRRAFLTASKGVTVDEKLKQLENMTDDELAKALKDEEFTKLAQEVYSKLDTKTQEALPFNDFLEEFKHELYQPSHSRSAKAILNRIARATQKRIKQAEKDNKQEAEPKQEKPKQTTSIADLKKYATFLKRRADTILAQLEKQEIIKSKYEKELSILQNQYRREPSRRSELEKVINDKQISIDQASRTIRILNNRFANSQQKADDAELAADEAEAKNNEP